MSTNSVSLVISTRNRGARILPTLQSILRGATTPGEIVVVDQSDAPSAEATAHATAQMAREFKVAFSHEEENVPANPRGTLRYVHSHQRGVSNGRNTGARAAQGAYLIFTDDDIIADANWVATVQREFASDSQIVGVYGTILPYTRQANAKRGRTTGIEVGREAKGRGVFTAPTLPWYLGSGGNMAFRRTAFEQCGGFDVVLGAGAPLQACEDLDIGYRMLYFGIGKIVFTSDALVYHDSPKNFAEQFRTEQGYGIGAGGMIEKYARCGDPRARGYLRTWVWHMAVRRFGAGLLKWRNIQVMRLALLQLRYPFIGATAARQYRINSTDWTFLP